MIPNRLQALGEQRRISAAIFFGSEYNFLDKRLWSVNLKYSHDGIKTEVNETGTNFEDTLQRAWSKLDNMISHGLGPSAMMPALEAPKPELNDEIPF